MHDLHVLNYAMQILARASSYNPSSGMCRLCLKEKYWIMFAPATASLNKRNEIFNSCRHRASKLLDKTWGDAHCFFFSLYGSWDVFCFCRPCIYAWWFWGQPHMKQSVALNTDNVTWKCVTEILFFTWDILLCTVIQERHLHKHYIHLWNL